MLYVHVATISKSRQPQTATTTQNFQQEQKQQTYLLYSTATHERAQRMRKKNRVICVYNLSRFSVFFTVFFRILCSNIRKIVRVRRVCVCVHVCMSHSTCKCYFNL